MDGPNYLSPGVAAEVREECQRLVEAHDDVYGCAVDVWGTLFNGLFSDAAPSKLYTLWAELTDLIEMGIRPDSEVEDMMRDAAREFLTLRDDTRELDSYLTRWHARLAQVEPHESTPDANRRWFRGSGPSDQ